MFGVRACGCPPSQPHQSFRLSTMMKRTFGPFAGRGSSCCTGTARGMIAGSADFGTTCFFVAADIPAGMRKITATIASDTYREIGITPCMK